MKRRLWNHVSSTLGALSVAFLAANACSNTLQGSLAIVTGPDDGFAMSPKPTSLTVQLINTSGVATTVATTGLPADAGLSLPSQNGSDIDVIQVTGFDDAGDAVVSGSTIPVALDQLAGVTLNLFAQRTGQFARLPSADGGTANLGGPTSSLPLLTTVYARYLLISDGTGASTGTQLYDTLTWQAQEAGPPLPMNATSLAYVDTYTGSDASVEGGTSISALLMVDKKGNFGALDLTDSTGADAEVTFDAALPSMGGVPSDIAGGQTVLTSSGITYIVGATRLTGSPTKGILRISPTGVLSWASLTTARLGAAATYVNGSLYVFGGASGADGGTAGSGIEELANGATVATAVSGIAPDPTVGAGAVAFDATHVLLAGGTIAGNAAPLRLFTIGSDNGIASLSSEGGTLPTLPVTFAATQVFALTAGMTTSGYDFSAVVVGSDATGSTSAYLVTATSANPLPFRVPHTNARAIVLPNGALGVVGGDSGTIESFIR